MLARLGQLLQAEDHGAHAVHVPVVQRARVHLSTQINEIDEQGFAPD